MAASAPIDTWNTVRQIVSDYEAALPWLRSFDRRSLAERLTEYEKACSRLSQRERMEWNHHDLLCLLDIEKLTQAWKYRHALQVLGDFDRRMSQAVRGKRFYANDVDPNGRNFLFEIECAVLLLRMGMALKQSCDGDLAAEWIGVAVLGECKRPSGSLRAFGKRIKQASEQIQSRRTNDEIGMVFLDLSLGINPDLDHYICESEEHSLATAKEIAWRSAQLLYERACRGLRSPHDAALFCHLDLPFFVGGTWVIHNRWISIDNPLANTGAQAIHSAMGFAAMRAGYCH